LKTFAIFDGKLSIKKIYQIPSKCLFIRFNNNLNVF